MVDQAQGLKASFLAGLSEAARAHWQQDASLDGRLTQLLSACREAHPGLIIDDKGFLRHLAMHLGDETDFESLHAADLYLAFGVSSGSGSAIERAHRELHGVITESVGKIRMPAKAREDVIATIVQEYLANEPGRQAKVYSYSGRGVLRGWLRVSATRRALKLVKKAQREESAAAELMEERLSGVSEDPELAYMKEIYRPAFRRAFQEALDSLDERDRNLLKRNLIDGESIDVLAESQQVHRATVARWLLKAKEQLVRETRERFSNATGASQTECESVMRLVQSQLDATIRRRLSDVS